MSEKISISGKVDSKSYKEFIKETSYRGIDKWKALSEAMKMFTEKLKKGIK